MLTFQPESSFFKPVAIFTRRPQMKRRDFLRFSLISAAGAAVVGREALAGASQEKVTFRFAHLTDIHVKPEDGAEEGFIKALEAVNALDPPVDFVITGGDLVYDALAAPYERADQLFKLYERCLSRLEVPVYNVIGNHDILGWYPWSGVSSSHPEFGKLMFKKRLGGGSSWRAFDHKGWHFILLDSIEWNPQRTEYMGRISQLQIEWLKEDLARVEPDTPIVIVTHIPFVSIADQLKRGGNAALGESTAIANSDKVLRMFSNHNLKLVLQGHLHRDERLVMEQNSFIMSGAVCGAWWRGANVHTEEGFGIIDVRGDDFSYTYYDYGWEL